jgi:hypothetical protein
MVAGTYGISMNGWATISPAPTVVPFAALGTLTFNDDNSGTTASGTGSLTQVMAGQAAPPMSINVSLTVSRDCTVSFKATCPAGCSWEGNGILYFRDKKEVHLLFTKVGAKEIPITTVAILKQI